MVTSLNFIIHAEPGEAEYGTAVIVPSRKSWYVDPVTVRLKEATGDLRLLYQSNAVEAGRILHHAECLLTNDPVNLNHMLEQHDCPECRAGAGRARDFLTQHPGQEIVIARLYWVKA